MEEEYFWAWLAGFFDGEGCFSIGIHKNKDTKFGYQIRPAMEIQISRRDYYVIQKIRKKLGYGEIIFRRQNHPKWSPLCSIRIRGLDKIFSTIEKIQPYLILKKNQCEMFLEACRIIKEKKVWDKESFLKICKIRDELHERTRPKTYRDSKFFENVVNSVKPLLEPR